jgi:hypothetical protein
MATGNCCIFSCFRVVNVDRLSQASVVARRCRRGDIKIASECKNASAAIEIKDLSVSVRQADTECAASQCFVR